MQLNMKTSYVHHVSGVRVMYLTCNEEHDISEDDEVRRSEVVLVVPTNWKLIASTTTEQLLLSTVLSAATAFAVDTTSKWIIL